MSKKKSYYAYIGLCVSQDRAREDRGGSIGSVTVIRDRNKLFLPVYQIESEDADLEALRTKLHNLVNESVDIAIRQLLK